MEDNNFSIYDDDTDTEEVVKERETAPIKNKKAKNNTFKEKECKVISYNKKSKYLDVNFDGFGIRVKDVKDFNGSTVVIKYKGEIGKANFEYKI